jgi:hypothetical protein
LDSTRSIPLKTPLPLAQFVPQTSDAAEVPAQIEV